VTRRIRVSGNQLCVLVLDAEGYERAEAQGQDLLALVKSLEMKGCKSPRLCHVSKNSQSGLGLSFTPVEGTVVVHNCNNHHLYKPLWNYPCTFGFRYCFVHASLIRIRIRNSFIASVFANKVPVCAFVQLVPKIEH